ncbi:MAG: thioredoxin [Gemmatimonadota bacterium]|jgi:thioredoxin 1
MAVMELTDAQWAADVEQSDGVTVVDFWAPWCGPCRIVGPVIEELAEEYAGEVRFGKLNVDENQQVAMAFNIRSIPTIGFFRDGEAVGVVVGAYPKEALKDVIEQVRRGEVKTA